MIPKRAGSAPSPLNDLPTLPPIPDTPVEGAAEYVMQPSNEPVVPVVPNNGPTAILNALSKYIKASKNNAVSKDIYENLLSKGLIVTYGDFAVISGKGLIYLVDFGIVT